MLETLDRSILFTEAASANGFAQRQVAVSPNLKGCGDVVDRITAATTTGSQRALLLYLDEHDTSVLA